MDENNKTEQVRNNDKVWFDKSIKEVLKDNNNVQKNQKNYNRDKPNLND